MFAVSPPGARLDDDRPLARKVTFRPRSAVCALLAIFVLARPGAAEDKTAAVELYAEKCALCHMPDGKSPVPELDFTDGKWKHGTSMAAIQKVISEGVPTTAMLPFKEQLTPEQIKALAEHVRAFDKSLAPEKGGKKGKK
jgi:mono/diheme cytochrome c family protein